MEGRKNGLRCIVRVRGLRDAHRYVCIKDDSGSLVCMYYAIYYTRHTILYYIILHYT